jgi:hypothetical protein
MAAAGHAEILALRLADNLGPSVEQSRDDRGIDLGYVALQQRRAVHHWDTGDHDVVLDSDGAAFELAARSALDRAANVPGVELVLFMRRNPPSSARIFDRRQALGRIGQLVELAEDAAHEG